MICEQCKNEGKTSTIHEPMGGSTTLMAFSPGYYDEQGKYHATKNPNKTTYDYRCSNGHSWSETV